MILWIPTQGRRYISQLSTLLIKQLFYVYSPEDEHFLLYVQNISKTFDYELKD